ncbi:MAG: ATP synthase F1 subunit epsilon [Clostridia bacterium]|nr:ATP synthase F1 subunit epsilon [Clostridia bacterium]
MSEYRLKIVTPDRMVFDSFAERLVARTQAGDVCILARHTEYIAPLAIGEIKVKADGKWRTASCSGGTLVVTGGETTIVADTFEWSDEIDLERAKRAKEKAEERLKNNATEFEFRLAELKLKRAINRINTGSKF